MTDEQKIARYDLENSQRPLTPGERLYLASLNDLRDAEYTGRDLVEAQEAVKQVEKVRKTGKTEELRDLNGGESVTRIKRALEDTVLEQEIPTDPQKAKVEEKASESSSESSSVSSSEEVPVEVKDGPKEVPAEAVIV